MVAFRPTFAVLAASVLAAISSLSTQVSAWTPISVSRTLDIDGQPFYLPIEPRATTAAASGAGGATQSRTPTLRRCVRTCGSGYRALGLFGYRFLTIHWCSFKNLRRLKGQGRVSTCWCPCHCQGHLFPCVCLIFLKAESICDPNTF